MIGVRGDPLEVLLEVIRFFFFFPSIFFLFTSATFSHIVDLVPEQPPGLDSVGHHRGVAVSSFLSGKGEVLASG